ncbi:T9SS type A sorting domain-containing protein [Ferruginibacter sp. SUN002]|uniref:T9SS type A sorting domain-containing protein n=1 Tax=Ferruginibacter sp. SUN002 TaxID=2937789 RepID=UPI003D366661
MKRLFTRHLQKSLSQKTWAFCISVMLLFFTSIGKSQTINEGFEEDAWSAVTTSTGGNATHGTVVVTQYANAGTKHTGSWLYSSGYAVTTDAANSKTYTVNSGDKAFHLGGSSAAYLISPIISDGVVSVTFWVRTASTTAAFRVYEGTNPNLTTATGNMSSSATNATGWSNSSGYTVNSTIGWTSVSYAVTGNGSSAPAFIKIQRNSSEVTIDDIEITTAVASTPPTVTTNTPVATAITASSATLGGNISDAGSGTITSSGFCYSTSANPTIADPKTTDGPTGVGAITSSISGLTFSTVYHVRAYATGSSGTTYGSDETFTTAAPSSPTILTNPTSLNFGSILVNTTSTEKTFTLVAGGLSPTSGNITVPAPSGYEVSLSSGSGFAQSILVPYTGAALSATTIYVRFSPTALITYTGDIDISGGGAAIGVAVSGSGNNIVYEAGDYKSVATGNWDATATWNKFDGTNWVAAPEFPNSQTASVFVTDGFTVTKATSGRSVKNLYVNNGATLKTNNLVNAPVYVRIYGTTVQVDPGSIIGNLLNGNNADGISLDIFGTDVTVTGGGTVNLSRMRTNTAATTITINTDVTLNYHGSGNAGNAAGFYTVAGDNNILTINAGKTLTFAPWSCYTPVSSSHTNGGNAQTINVNGTLTFTDGLVPGNATANGWSGHTNGYMSLGVTGKAFNLNIGATGVLNVSEFYPNGTKADNTPGTGDLTTITVAAGGALNVSRIADFRNPLQTVTGAGAFNLGFMAKMRIGSTDGITTSAAAGPIQTTTRGYNAGTYAYEGTAAQVSGNGLPAVASGLVINNAAGLTMTKSTSLADSLNLTNGIITNTAAEKITLEPGGIVNGGSNTSHVNGPITKQTASTFLFTFPVGKGGVYHPASIIAADATLSSYTAEYFNTSAASTSSTTLPLTSVGTSEYWDIKKDFGTDAFVGFNFDNTLTTTWSNAGVPNVSQEIVVAHLVAGNWVDATAANGTAISGGATSGVVNSQLLSSFSPFTFGLRPAGTTPVNLISFSATSVDGQTKLYWSANNELNVAKYIVERSTDGKNFSSTNAVTMATNLLNNNYSVTDAAQTSAVSYYRLKIVDRDGRYTYSNIIAVNNKVKTGLTVFPNPVANNLYVSHSKATVGAKLEIYSIDGRKISEQQVTRDAVQTTINATGLPKGTYNLVLVNGGKAQHLQFVKQ